VGEIGDIAIGAVGAAAVGLLVALVVRAWQQRQWQRVVWAFKFPARAQPRVIMETIEGEETGLYRRPSAGLGAVAAVAQLATVINASRSGLVHRLDRSLEFPIDLEFSSEPKADTWCSTADTIIVGGPKSNHITAQVLRAFGCQPEHVDVADDEFDAEEEELLNRTRDFKPDEGAAKGLGLATLRNNLYWFGTKVAGEVRVKTDLSTGTRSYNGYDYGVVLRLPSPTSADRRTVVVFGSQTFGVNAASQWLVNLRSRPAGRTERSTMTKHKNIAVLVRADVKHGQLSEPQVVETVRLPARLERRHW
jgi:hypothetical protein